jgi:hypothetical protein
MVNIVGLRRRGCPPIKLNQGRRQKARWTTEIAANAAGVVAAPRWRA